jgi:hypothetical protein
MLQLTITNQHFSFGEESVLAPLEAATLQSTLTTLIDEEDLLQHLNDVDEMFWPPECRNVCMYPFQISESRRMLIVAGNRLDEPH